MFVVLLGSRHYTWGGLLLLLKAHVDDLASPDAREGTADSRDQGTKHLDIVAGGVQHDNTEVHCHQVLLKDEVTICGQQHVKMVLAIRSNAPFLVPAQPISGTVHTSCSLKSRLSRLGTHSSSSIRISHQ